MPRFLISVLGVIFLMSLSSNVFSGPRSGPLKGNTRLNFKSPANPPFLNWPLQPEARSYRVQLSRNKTFPKDRTLSCETRYNFLTPERYLDEGVWYYRIQPQGGEWSDAYTVEIEKGATRFLIPKRKGYIKEHPRLYLHAKDIPGLRQDARDARKVLWEKIEERAKSLIGAKLPSEPPRHKPMPDGSLDIQAWRNIVNVGGRTQNDLITLSFAYIISEDKAYLNEVKRILDNVCGWDIPGSTADPTHVDHSARDIVHGMCIAYDWLHDKFTLEEQVRIKDVIARRAEKLYECDNPFYGFGANNHPWFRVAGLADAAALLLGEDPRAEEWLDFCQQIYAGRFYCLGGSDGEWHEGISYWGYALLFALEFNDVVLSSTGVDFYRHPWIEKTADFPIYAYPPHSFGLPFGDVHPGQRDMCAVLASMRLAKATRNPYAKWYVQQPYESSQFYVQRFMAEDPTLPAKAPLDIPQSYHFKDAGWALFHTSLAGKDDVFLALKSGPYFASGHEHPDQNSFALEAFGKRLIIDSGYYDWYGSSHFNSWVTKTKAHNVIMVNGKGQSGKFEENRDPGSGKIAAFFRSPVANFCIGDASDPKVYTGRVKRFDRKIAFLPSGLTVMLDDIELPQPSKIDWLLHVSADPEIDASNLGFDMQTGDAGLRFDFLAPEKLQVSRTVGYDPAPEKINPQDVHLTFTLPDKVGKTRFVSVYQPYKVGVGEPVRKFKRHDGKGAVGALVGKEFFLFRTDSAEKSISAGRLETDGQMAFLDDSGWSLCMGTTLSVDKKVVFSASRMVSISAKTGNQSRFWFAADRKTVIKLAIDKAPKKIPVGWKYDPKVKVLSAQVPAGESEIVVE